MVHDSAVVYERLLGLVLSVHYTNTAFTFDLVTLIRDNLETLCYKTSLLTRFFPNILKVSWLPELGYLHIPRL